MDIVLVLLNSSTKHCATIKAKARNTSKTYAMSCKCFKKRRCLCIVSGICFSKNEAYIVPNEELSENYVICTLL